MKNTPLKKHNRFNLFFILSIVFLLNNLSSFSQTKIRGSIIDAETGENIPFASISFPETTEGTVSDFNGNFFLESYKEHNSILINCIGFISDSIKIKPNTFQEITIKLHADNYGIDEVVIHAGENPANILLKKVLRHKKQNNMNKLKTYSYEQYTKMQVDINNFNSDIANETYLKDFKKAFTGIDTSAATGKNYMPLIISETLSEFYFKKSPRHRKELIKAVNTAGIKNITASKFTGQMYVDFNFYKSYIKIMDKEFVSPIALSGLMVYDYYLIDSAFIDNSWCYHLTYKPKRKYEYTFKGDMWIADTSFALKKISAQMSKTANLSFVSSLYVKKNYKKTDNNFFFPVKEEFFVDFNISKLTYGFFGRKITYRKNIKLNPEFPTLFFSPTDFKEIEIEDNAAEYDSSFWNKNRYELLSKKEENIYKMVDNITNQPTFKKIENFVYLIATGFLKIKYIELGPYYKIYSKNAIEGSRFRLGTRTSNNFSKKIELNSYAAYGIKDQKLKYGFGSKWKIYNKKWTLAQINYSKDFVQLGANLGDYGSDNIYSVSGENDKLLFIEDLELGIEHDLTKSLTTTVFFSNKKISPTDSIFFLDKANANVANITSSELTLSAHFGINEEYIEANFNRQSFGSLYPIIEAQFTYGIPNFLGSKFKYSKITIGLKHYVSFAFLGKTKYYIEAGKIFGTVPFPLLKLHEGNMSYIYDKYSFNLMNYYEFASDEYISFFAEHHFNGLILNKIPIIRRLKFREVIYAKGVWGNLSEKNKNVLQLPNTLSDVKKPYIELGLGIENILNFLSVNYFRRLTHIHKNNIRKNGIIFGINVQF